MHTSSNRRYETGFDFDRRFTRWKVSWLKQVALLNRGHFSRIRRATLPCSLVLQSTCTAGCRIYKILSRWVPRASIFEHIRSNARIRRQIWLRVTRVIHVDSSGRNERQSEGDRSLQLIFRDFIFSRKSLRCFTIFAPLSRRNEDWCRSNVLLTCKRPPSPRL